jgi:hypothetical protein
METKQETVQSQATKILEDAQPKAKAPTDLSELGEQYVGFAPKPSPGQDWETFVAEVLAPKDVTRAAFEGSEYFKSQPDAFKSLFESDRSHSAEASPVVEKPIVVREANEVIVRAPTSELGTGAGVSLASVPMPDPTIRSSFTSQAKMETSGRKLFTRLLYEDSFLPDLDPKRQAIPYLELIMNVIRRYAGIYVGIKNAYDPITMTMKTDASQAGFDIGKYFESEIHVDHSKRYLSEWRQHSAPHKAPKLHVYDRVVEFHGLRSEAEVIKALAALEQRHLYPVSDYHTFQRLWDSQELALKDIDPTIILEKRRIWVDWGYENYMRLMDNNPAFITMIHGLVAQHVHTGLRVGTKSDRSLLSNLYQTIQFRSNTVDKSSQLAAEINKSDGIPFLRTLVTALQLGRWTELSVDISMDSKNVNTILGILMIKLVTPRSVWSDRAVLLMHNYLAKWFVSALPDYKGGFDDETFDFGDDQLESMLSHGPNWGGQNTMAKLRSFLLEWSDSGGAATFALTSVNGESVPLHLTNEHGRLPLWHREDICDSTTNHAYLIRPESAKYRQLRNFLSFVQYITVRGKDVRAWKRLDQETVLPLVRILAMLSERRSVFEELAYAFNKANRFLSMHTLTGRHDAEAGIGRVAIDRVDPISVLNLVLVVEPATVQCVKFSPEMYNKANGIHHFLSDLGDGVTLARKMLSRRYFQRKEILAEAMKFVRPHPLKAWVEKDMLERYKVFSYEQLQPRGILREQVPAARRFLQAVRNDVGPAALSYATSFIFANGYERDIRLTDLPPSYSQLQVCKNLPGIPEVTADELTEMVAKGTLRTFLNGIDGPIRFKIPIAVTATTPIREPIMPFTLPTATTPLRLRSIPVGNRWKDEDLRYDVDEVTPLVPSAYYVEAQYVPWRDVAVDYPLREMIHHMHVWSELEFGVPIERISVIRRAAE